MVLTQLKEIEGTLICPREFLMPINHRREKLEEAKNEWHILTEPAKQWLTYKLLMKEEHFTGTLIEDERVRAQTLFLKIAELAGPLHQGTELLNKGFFAVYQTAIAALA
jgi:hypothetical protein